jgi:hypothetical protein
VRGTVTDSNARIPPDRFLVYYFRTQDHVRCDRTGKFLDGTNEAGALFESMELAKTFAQSVANVTPQVGAGVFNAAYQPVAEFLHPAFLKKQKAAEAPSRLLLWAGALLVAGSAFLWYEIHSGWTAMFGFLIGSRLIFGGVMKAARGIYRWRRKSL